MTDQPEPPKVLWPITRRIDLLPIFREVTLTLACDNDMINRLEPEELFLDKVESIIAADGMYDDHLAQIEAVLFLCTKEERETMAAGEHSEVQALVAALDAKYPQYRIGPDGLGVGTAINGLLNDIFEGG